MWRAGTFSPPLAARFFSHYLTPVMFALALIFVALPLLDIVSLIKAGEAWGFWPTVGVVIAAGLAGVTIVRHQGFSIGRQVQHSLNAGRLPVIEAFNGACVLAAGALLLFPGLASDVVAALLLLPPVRALMRRAVAWRLRRGGGEVLVWTHQAPGNVRGAAAASPGKGTVIEGEFEPVEPRPAAEDAVRLPAPAGDGQPGRDQP
jgi:UPF0716 protein FxsA